MTLTQAQRLAREETLERLIHRVRTAVGLEMSVEEARSILERAKVLKEQNIPVLDEHFAEHPDAFTNPSSDCPLALVRLLRLLNALGHGERVALARCSGCGSASRTLDRSSPAGRCCSSCARKSDPRQCVRCGRVGHIHAKRPDGHVCRACLQRERRAAQPRATCVRCGRAIQVKELIAPTEAFLCGICGRRRSLRPRLPCVRCGEPTTKQVADSSPRCEKCRQTPPRRCGKCGEVRVINVRASGDNPDICKRCYRQYGECVVCRKVRNGSKMRGGGGFRCNACRPKIRHKCDGCGETKNIQTRWPAGRLCSKCTHRRIRHPAACGQCGSERVLVGRDDDRRDVCAPCAGSDLDFTCRACGQHGDIYSKGECARCVVRGKLAELVSVDGEAPVQLRPLIEALLATNPHSRLTWLRRSPAAEVLATLAAERAEITHELLDRLPQTPALSYLREAMVTAGVLPRRHEVVVQLELWATSFASELPPNQQLVIRPFVEWDVLRQARRRAGQGRYTYQASAADKREVGAAVEFLTWLEGMGASLADATQEHMDRWLDENPTKRLTISTFARWITKRKLCAKLQVVIPKRPAASLFLNEGENQRQLRRCLTEEELPLEVRVAGALVRLYALPVTKIVELTADKLGRDNRDCFLVIDRNPVLLPPKLAQLVDQLIRKQGHGALRHAPGQPLHLFPGRPPSRPRHPASLAQLMNRHGLPVIHARNTAMLEAVSELPSIVVSDLFGMHPQTTVSWARFARSSWTGYLAATTANTESDPPAPAQSAGSAT